MWELSSLTKGQSRVLCAERQSLNHWTTKEVPLTVSVLQKSLSSSTNSVTAQ